MASPRIMSAEDIPPEALSLQVAGVGFSDEILELLVNHAFSSLREPSNGNFLPAFAPVDDPAEPLSAFPVSIDVSQSSPKQEYARPDQWDIYRPIITDLYGRKPLHEVREEMASRFSFYAR